MTNFIKSFIVICSLLFLIQFPAFADNQSFPLRTQYPQVYTVSGQWLYENRFEVTIIDVRSEFEYQVLHIDSAINIPISNKGFATGLKQLRELNERPLVFYCNGMTCRKSYQAVIAAQKMAIDQVYAFDGGIYQWANAYPYATYLLGHILDSEQRLISEKKFAAHNLTVDKFINKISADTLVIDVRDPFQKNVEVMADISISMPLDKSEQLLSRLQRENKTLLIFDAVGKQVRWLQYLIEKQGFNHYYFLKGGAEEFAKTYPLSRQAKYHKR